MKCSICGKSKSKVRKMVHGPRNNICYLCMEEILNHSLRNHQWYSLHWFYPIFESHHVAVDQRLIGTWAVRFIPKKHYGVFFTVKKEAGGWMKFGYRSLSPSVSSEKIKLVEKLAREGKISPKKRHRMKYVNFEMGYQEMWIRWDQYYRMYVSKLGDRTFLNMKYLDRYYLLEYELFGDDTLYTYKIDIEFIEKAIADKTIPGEIFELGAPHEHCRLVKCNPALVRAHIMNTPQQLLFPIEMKTKWKRLDSQQTKLYLKYFES